MADATGQANDSDPADHNGLGQHRCDKHIRHGRLGFLKGMVGMVGTFDILPGEFCEPKSSRQLSCELCEPTCRFWNLVTTESQWAFNCIASSGEWPVRQKELTTVRHVS
ncbi:hypothetical protein LBMAG52_34020 [Planctomycetia bacterium]|nr:hypothetical protein LBMAG52_34020 [Planctomycetia bacterium]